MDPYTELRGLDLEGRGGGGGLRRERGCEEEGVGAAAGVCGLSAWASTLRKARMTMSASATMASRLPRSTDRLASTAAERTCDGVGRVIGRVI